ncbi:hypothetical protein ACIBEJ_10150 [Nonomuraea sp. NPDC050790]|uniref:hypothetical protein n=1 Tax=Nonomuraea sp. NPDC050790 TaxID=3364371 RepID=UPI0037B5DE8A
MTAPPARRPAKSSKVITLSVIGVVSVMVVGFCAAQGDDDVTADCVRADSLNGGAYEVVDDDYCDDDRYYVAGAPYRAYRWYYGGTRNGARVHGGSTIRPSDVTISSRDGKSIQRGGFGSRWSGGS